MIGGANQIEAGREAWVRIRDRDKKTWEDWIAVSRAISIGRTAALKAAKTNQPVGTKYNREMGKWLVASTIKQGIALFSC
jgi:hypothetical protein